MEVKNYFAQDSQGNAQPNATCYLYAVGTEKLVTGLTNITGQSITNPFHSDSFGLIQFKAPNGLYDLRVVSGVRDYRIRVQANDLTESINAATEQANRANIAANEAGEYAREASIAAEASLLSEGIFATVELGLAGTTTGKYFSVPSTNVKEYLNLYKNNAGAPELIDTYPSKAAIDGLGFEDQDSKVSGIEFGIVDDIGRRTWLESMADGGPSEYSAGKIGKTLTADNSPTLTEGITTHAVEQAIDAVGIESLANINDQSFAIVDEDGRRLWLEAAKDGGPTEYAATKIGRVLTADNSPEFAGSISAKVVVDSVAAVGIEFLNPLNEQSFSISDEDGRRLWLEAAKDGGPTEYAMKCIVDKLPEDIGGASSTYLDKVKGDINIVSGPNITCWGDSMTAGAGGAGTSYTSVLQSLLNTYGYSGTVNNRGVGGENSVTITARAGANPFVVIPTGGVIPATTTAFEIKLQPINGIAPKPLMQGAITYTGRLGDIPGTFSRTVVDTTYTYYFTRATAGTEVIANRPIPLYLNIGDQYRGDITIIWIGQNGPSDTRAIQDAKAIIQRMNALDKRYIVISRPGGTSADDVNDALWFAEFGRRFIPIRQYMVKYGLDDAGITPTSQDIIDIANGTVPSSLRVDPTHWTGAGYTILGNVVFKLIKEMEWI